MALPNPTINPPRLSFEASRGLHSRSPSRSPVRQSIRDFDPILRSLSPTTTLRAFSNRPGEVGDDALAKSIESASHSERALGVQAAQAWVDVRGWVRELEAWEWPGTFDMPERVRKKLRMSNLSLFSRSESVDQVPQVNEANGQGEDEHWGSLPADKVQAYEKRMDEIAAALDEIDVEELKDFVLSAHTQAGGEASIDDSIGAIGAATDLKRLDDFTALITATILQSLPYLSRLTRLLNTWNTRLSILRSSPKYLRDLKQARTDLDHGWAALAVSPNINQSKAAFSRETMDQMKSVVERQVYNLGKRLDGFLDMLEGRVEVVPDSWIEDFEELEGQYGAWVVQAERKALEEEWRTSKKQDDAMLGQLEGKREEMVAPPEETQWPIEYNAPTEPARAIETFVSGPVTTTIQSSSNGTTTTSAMPTSTSRGMETFIASPTSTVTTTTHRHGNLSTDMSTHTTTTGPTSTTVNTTTSPNKHSRHVPIVVDYSKPDEITTAAGAMQQALNAPKQTDADSAAGSKRDLSPLVRTATQKSETGSNDSSTMNVKKRAAFLNGDIERSDSLIKSKSAPIVRPFEHASNAFTRLFKRDGSSTPEPESVVSSGSKGSKKSEATAAGGAAGLVDVPARNKSRDTTSNGESSASRHGKKSSIDKARNNRMEYMDMVRMPEFQQSRKSEDGNQKRSGRPSTRESQKKNMQYGDLVSVPVARSSTETRESQQTNFQQGDMVSTSRPSKESKRSSRPDTPSTYGHRKTSSRDIPFAAVLGAEPSRLYPDDTTARIRNRDSREVGITALPQPPTSASAMKRPETPKRAPETYTPTGLLHSPFHSPTEAQNPEPEFPADWPLSVTATPSERRSPDKEYFGVSASGEESTTDDSLTDRTKTEGQERALDSEDFERVFVGGMPQRPGSSTSEYTTVPDREGYKRPSTAPALQWNVRPRADKDLLRSGGKSSRRLELRESSATLPRPVSMVEEVEEAADVTPEEESSGDDATPSDNNAAGYFGSSGKKLAAATLLKRSKSTPPVSPMMLKLKIPDQAASDPETTQAKEEAESIVRRASATSIESHPRSKLKSVDISRKSSIGSNVGDIATTGIDETPEPQTPIQVEQEGASSPLNYKGVMIFPSPPNVPLRQSSLRSTSSSKRSSTETPPRRQLPTGLESSPFTEDEATLNAVMGKSKLRDTRKPSRIPEEAAPLKPGEDNFDRHVSEVLDRVHAPIKFRTRPGAETPVPSTGANAPAVGMKGYGTLRAKAERQGKNMTLAPAEPSPRKSTAAEPEVKLYHLTQAGRSEPIKLYVRLVGEGERVMVRVGGGWADLADYLRQYAEHHGSRTVSESLLEVQTAQASSSKRTFSGPAASSGGPVEPKSLRSTPITPTSAFPLPEYDQAFPASPSDTYDMESSSPSSPSQRNNMNAASYFTQRGTTPTSRPSTSDGLSGTTPKGELPEQKAKWVEGMLERAKKSASAERNLREERERYFGEMGKVGQTRRVVFRSSSGVGEGVGGAK